MTSSTAEVEAVRSLARASRVLERASDELSLADYRMLSAIAEGEGRASRLAARLTLGKPAISSSVDSLCRRGLLQRHPVEGDQRATALSLTVEGQAVFENVEGAMVARLVALAALTPDSGRLLESLVWLGAAIETVMAERALQA
ncbi:MAG: hypothetical protein JWO10_2252 [Microbacteriaceae bacterium]|nr:hypothetical protein [Microbacteriaceae bacterium]